MNNTDSFTPQEYAKMVGMFPDAPNNPLPTGGYMDEGFDWVVNQAEESNYSFEPYTEHGVFAHDTDDCRGILRFEENSRIGVCEDCGEKVQISKKSYDWITNEWFEDYMQIIQKLHNAETDKEYLREKEQVAGLYSFEPYTEYGVFAHDTDDCRGTLRFEEDSRIGVCEDCGEKVQISKKDYDWITNEWFGDFEAETDKEYLREKEQVAGLDKEERYELYDENELDCDECGAVNKTVGYVEEGYKLCQPCDREMMAKQGYEAENESAVYEPSSEPTGESPATEPTNENPNLFNSELYDFLDPAYKSIKKNKDWLSLALGTTAVVLGGGLFAQSKGWLNFGADGDEAKEEGDLPPAPADEPSLVASPSTGDLLPADYEEMIVESTGYAVPVIPVGLDGSFMGSRFHALPTDRLIESNEPGVGSHTDVAMYRDTNYREPQQTMITQPPFGYVFNSESECECSLFEKIKSFFTGKDCCEGKETKEANSITGQSPYFGYGFEGKNPQARVIKETNPISLDPSTAPYLPLNLSGYTGQAYTPPTIYADMMAIGSSGMNIPFSMPAQSSVGANHFGSRSVDSSALKSVNGNLNESVNQSYTDGSRTMSLAQWSIEFDVSQISDTEAYAVSRSSGERKMIRRV